MQKDEEKNKYRSKYQKENEPTLEDLDEEGYLKEHDPEGIAKDFMG